MNLNMLNPHETLENNAKEVLHRFQDRNIVVDGFVKIEVAFNRIALDVYHIDTRQERMNNDYNMREVLDIGPSFFFLMWRDQTSINTLVARSADLTPKENELWIKIQWGTDFYPNIAEW